MHKPIIYILDNEEYSMVRNVPSCNS